MINLLNEVAEEGFGSAAFLTYGIDLNFFDTEVMRSLQESGCRNVLVVADGHQLKDDLNSAAWLRYVGVHCPIVPVRLGDRAFHPKAVPYDRRREAQGARRQRQPNPARVHAQLGNLY
jgi:hypothetical protein